MASTVMGSSLAMVRLGLSRPGRAPRCRARTSGRPARARGRHRRPRCPATPRSSVRRGKRLARDRRRAACARPLRCRPCAGTSPVPQLSHMPGLSRRGKSTVMDVAAARAGQAAGQPLDDRFVVDADVHDDSCARRPRRCLAPRRSSSATACGTRAREAVEQVTGRAVVLRDAVEQHVEHELVGDELAGVSMKPLARSPSSVPLAQVRAEQVPGRDVRADPGSPRAAWPACPCRHRARREGSRLTQWYLTRLISGAPTRCDRACWARWAARQPFMKPS